MRTVSGVARQGDVAIAYEAGGAGDTAICLLPGWTLADRRLWEAPAAALRRDFRVIRYDGRGNGASDRPVEPAAYEVTELVADVIAVLDATGTRRAVLVGNSLGGLVAYAAAALRPERVAGLVLINATVNLAADERAPLVRAMAAFEEDLGADAGWARYNRHSWRRDYAGFVEWFVDTALGDHPSGAGRAEGIASGLATTPEVLAASVAGRSRLPLAEQAGMLRAIAPMIACPALVITGERDEVVPPAWGRALAEALRAEYVTIPGAGHCPQITRPVEINGLVAGFAAPSAGEGRVA